MKKLALPITIFILAVAGVAIFALTRNQATNQQVAGLTACPEHIEYKAEGRPEITFNGQTHTASLDEITYIDSHCKSGDQQSTGGEPLTMRTFFSGDKCIGNAPVTYSKPIIALSDLGQITPLGRMYDSHVTPTDHQYWQPVDNTVQGSPYPVYSPADGYIVSLEQHKAGKADTSDIGATSTVDEFRIVIEHSCNLYTVFNHVRALPDVLFNQANFATDSRVNRPKSPIRIAIKAGDQVGKVGANTFDVQSVDESVTVPGLLKPATYESEIWKIHTTDPISHYSEPLKTQYYAKVSRSVEPIGGKVDFDLAGKLVGNWFKQGTNGYNNLGGRYWDGHLSIVYDPHIPSKIIVSSGHSLTGISDQYLVIGTVPDPATVSASSGIVRYPLFYYKYLSSGKDWDITKPAKDMAIAPSSALKGYLLAQIQADGNLKAEIIEGNAGTQANFSDKATLYTR